MNFVNSTHSANVRGMIQSISNKLPNPPTSLVYTAGSATVSEVTISFTAPTNVPILTYTASTGSSLGTPAAYTISGLASNTTYNLTLIANGIFKSSVSSSPALSILTKPGAPTIGTATVSGTTATVPFTAPSGNGIITGYTVTSNIGGFTGTGSSSPISVSGLTAGSSYTFTVTATNASGTSVASAASNSLNAASATPTFTISSVTNWQVGDITGTSVVNGITYKVYVFKKSGVAYTVNYNLDSPGQVYMLAVGGGGQGGGDQGGGAGAGGFIQATTSTISAGTSTISISVGAASGTQANSIISALSGGNTSVIFNSLSKTYTA